MAQVATPPTYMCTWCICATHAWVAQQKCTEAKLELAMAYMITRAMSRFDLRQSGRARATVACRSFS